MLLTEFQKTVLDRVSYDYETIESVRESIVESIGRSLPETAISETLLMLHRNGLVQAYRCDKASTKYVPITEADTLKPLAVWFMATPQGKELVGADADDEEERAL